MASTSKLSYWADKLAVESEPGLTSTQLMVRPPPSGARDLVKHVY